MSVGMLPLLLSLVFAAYGNVSAQGVAPPCAIDFSHLTLPKTPNKALGPTAGFTPTLHLITPRYAVSQASLFAIVGQVSSADQRTCARDDHRGHFQAARVARMPTSNFPVVTPLPDPLGGSKFILYSHSIDGQSDFGANQAWLKTWPGAIEAKVAGAKS